MFSYFGNGFRSWWSLVRFIAYFFSIGPLLKTLFSGWRRDTASEREALWERLVLRAIIGVIGFLIRLIVIAFGLVALLLSIPLLPFFVVLPIRPSYENLVRLGSIGKSWAYGGSSTLHHYGVSLYRGNDKKLYGREATLDYLTRVLSRDDQDNVLLVGAPGSGRETLVTQFAKSVYRGLVPEKLKNREVIELPLGDTPRPALEKIFDEVRTAGNIVLVLHDVEKYEGMFSQIVPLLSAPELQIIAITTLEGYHAAWKERAEVMRYFEKIEVPPLGDAETLEFLKDLARERYRKVRFEEGVFEEIVRRTNQLVQHVPQPEKSVDLLQNLVSNAKSVTVADVQKVLSEETGVPVGELARDEKQILLTLEDVMKKEIIGQDEAVHDIAAALRRARAGVASTAKPIGTFLFLGPTGSGKTHTGKMLAKHYFGSDDRMVRFDMSEFATEESGSMFIERMAVAVEEQPFGLLFLDELEKAHRSIWNTLLQVLDEGRLTTRVGRTVSFTNNIIIATSNAGTAYVEQHPEVTRDELMDYLVGEHQFTPEFLNRFDDVVLFRKLSREDALALARLMLEDLNTRLTREKGVTVAITDELIRSLVAVGYSDTYGARALRRAVQEKVENVVAEMILTDQIVPGTPITIKNL